MNTQETTVSEQHAAKRRWLNAHEEGYHKAMGNRQVQMIAIGGAIGTGLFLGAGARLQMAGPALALVSGSVEPRLRGSFMSFSGSVQQLGSGIASLLAGLIIGRAVDGTFTRYHWVGWCAVVCTLLAIVLARSIRIVPDGSTKVE